MYGAAVLTGCREDRSELQRLQRGPALPFPDDSGPADGQRRVRDNDLVDDGVLEQPATVERRRLIVAVA